jgi:methyltransferase (TIGR00027 family)
LESWLGATARWTAAVRAKEHTRPDRLIEDPWAELLAGKEGMEWIETRGGPNTISIILRTRYFDEWLQRITMDESVTQVVLPAAGLDTRAFRLRLPQATHVFELDRASVLEYKEAVLASAGAQATCTRHVIHADLTGAWKDALVGAGFDPARPSAWLLEGLLFYLPSDAIKNILCDLSPLAAPGSHLGMDVINSAMLTSPLTHAWIEMQAKEGAPWIGTLDNPEEFLASLGWQATLTQAGQPDANHGRWTFPVIPTRMPNMPHNWFVTARKQNPVS